MVSTICSVKTLFTSRQKSTWIQVVTGSQYHRAQFLTQKPSFKDVLQGLQSDALLCPGEQMSDSFTPRQKRRHEPSEKMQKEWSTRNQFLYFITFIPFTSQSILQGMISSLETNENILLLGDANFTSVLWENRDTSDHKMYILCFGEKDF